LAEAEEREAAEELDRIAREKMLKLIEEQKAFAAKEAKAAQEKADAEQKIAEKKAEELAAK